MDVDREPKQLSTHTCCYVRPMVSDCVGGFGVNLTESFRQPCAAGTKARFLVNSSVDTSRCKMCSIIMRGPRPWMLHGVPQLVLFCPYMVSGVPSVQIGISSLHVLDRIRCSRYVVIKHSRHIWDKHMGGYVLPDEASSQLELGKHIQNTRVRAPQGVADARLVTTTDVLR